VFEAALIEKTLELKTYRDVFWEKIRI